LPAASRHQSGVGIGERLSVRVSGARYRRDTQYRVAVRTSGQHREPIILVESEARYSPRLVSAPRRCGSRDVVCSFEPPTGARLIEAAKRNRWSHRDATMVLVAYRHGLRASELVDLRWDQVDFRTASLHVRRVKQGSPSTHPILGDELRALRRLQRKQEPKSSFVFTSERGAPFSTAGFARMVERAGIEATLAIKAHPHMLRHACGYALANKGHETRALQAYLGHRNIQHTVRYTELSPARFKDFWRR
jgi:integrase